MLPRPEPNGHGAPNGAELAQRTYTRATDSSAATDRYAAMWGSSNPTLLLQHPGWLVCWCLVSDCLSASAQGASGRPLGRFSAATQSP